MTQSLLIRYAIACLEALDVPQKPEELSGSQHVPLEDCKHILRQFESAGMVRENAQGFVERTCEMSDLTALQVLQALWAAKPAVTGQMLYEKNSAQAAVVTQRILQTAAWPRG